MKKISFLIISLVFCCTNVFAQMADIGITKTLALGEVTAMNAEAKTLTLKTKDGDIVITLNDATQYKKASPDNPADLTKATPAALADISVGDRLIASGKIADDKKSMISRSIILMTKGDISKRQQTENEAWTKGINGRVTAVNPLNKELTVTVRGMMGERAIVISDTSNTKFRRYASNSVRYSDAQPGNYNDVKTGDQLRARGSRSDDGTHFTAEEIISGTFRTVGGVITAIDAAKNEVTINDVITKKPVTISLSTGTPLHKFPLEMAQRYVMMQTMVARGQMGQGTPGQGPNGQGARPPQTGGTPQAGGTPQTPQTGQAGQTTPQTGGPTGQGGMVVRPGGGGRGDFDEMLEKLPVITMTDLKVGDAIAVSSTPGQDPGRVSAIKLLAGVEPFLNAPAISMPQGAGRQQSSPSINIPGLDGIGSP